MAMTGDQIYGRQSLPRMSGGGWGAFVRRRLAEIAGGVFILIALAYLLSVLTAHESDPSFSRAVDGPVLNLMGPVGAYVGDFALQGLGLAAIIFALAPAAWGWKLIRDRRLERWWLKITLLPFAALLSAGACAAIPTTGHWPWIAGMGGFSGRLLLIGADGQRGLKSMLDSFGVPPLLDSPLLPATFMLAVAAAFVVFFTLGISLGGYVRAGRRVANAGHKVGQAIDRGRLSLTRRKADEDEDEEDEDSPGEQRPGFLQRLFQRAPKAAGAPRVRVEPSFDGNTRVAEIDLPTAPSLKPESKGGLVSVFHREKKPRAKPAKRDSAKQAKLDFEGEFELPSVDLLARAAINAAAQRINEESLEKNARLLETVLDDFGVKGQITRIRPGPVVTLYELEPAPGTKTSRVVSLADDVARSMSAVSVRIAVVPGRSVIGIELPNRER